MNDKKLETFKNSIKYSVSQKERTEQVVIEMLKEKEIKNVFLVGCGGSLMVMYPAKYILERNSELPLFVYNAGELMTIKPKTLNENSLVILSSYSGKTDEVIKSFEYASEIGATTIGFSEKDSPLGNSVDYLFELKSKNGVNESQIIMLYQIMFNIIKLKNSYEHYTDLEATMETLADNLVNLKLQVEKRAEKFALENKDEEFFMVIGSGPNWGEAYTFATCNLEEMQWITAQPVNAGEFFHGTFEIVRKDTNIVIFNGEGETRSLINRVLDFTEEYCDYVTLIDTKDFKLPGINENLREYFSPLIISVVKSVFFSKLAEIREHPVSTRKYMGKIEY